MQSNDDDGAATDEVTEAQKRSIRLTAEQVLLGVLLRVGGLPDAIPWRTPGEHFEHEHTQRPPIDAEVCGNDTTDG